MCKIEAEIISSWFMQLHTDMSNQLEKFCPLTVFNKIQHSIQTFQQIPMKIS